MLDLQKLINEFVFLREKLEAIAVHIGDHENAKAAFIVGCLHNICHSHAVTISQLIPPPPLEDAPAAQDNAPVAPAE